MFDNTKFRVAPFILAIICFVLPFQRLSCSMEPSMGWSITGGQLVAGGQIEVPNFMSGGVKKETFGSEPLAVFALLAALTGAGTAIPAGSGFRVTSAVCGGGGAISLLTLRSRVNSEVFREGQGLVVVDHQFGFWAVVLLLLAAVAIHGLLARTVASSPASYSQ